MQYRKLGQHGLELSVLSLGTWSTCGKTVDSKTLEHIFGTAYDLGINYFDTAETYDNGGAETRLGELLYKFNWPRETIVISGKVFWGTHEKRPNTWGLSRKHVIEGCNATLKRLRLDYLDLFLCHRACLSTPIEETVLAMNTLILQGKILYWGTSEWTSDQFLTAYRFAKENHLFVPVIEQLQYNLFHQKKVQQEFETIYPETGFGLTVWSPLKSGLLAGRYSKEIPVSSRLANPDNAWLMSEIFGEHPEQRLEKVSALEQFSMSALGIPLKQVALAWCMQNKLVTSVITGATSVEQVTESVEAVSIKLSLDVLKNINAIISA